MKIFVPNPTELNDPEILAMLQSMYSRSAMGIEERLADLAEGDSGQKQDRIRKAIRTYYLDYGHASIADCANVAVFVEGVSMLAAKALQDHPLYNGQERSTRYQDFSTVPYYSVTVVQAAVNERWREFYSQALPQLETWVKATREHQRDDILGEASASLSDEAKAASWNRSVKAIAFDYARGLLPCGATTSLSMYMSLRKFRDHLSDLAAHPLIEVQKIAVQINEQLTQRFPNTFKSIKPRNDVATAYVLNYVNDYKTYASIEDTHELTGVVYVADPDLRTHFGLSGCLDFGSFRDLQRHRNGVMQMPLVSHANNLNAYYTRAYKAALTPELFSAILDQYDSLQVSFPAMSVEAQYVLPLMNNVSLGMYWSLAQVKYVLELRSKTSVHPTLRDWSHSLHNQLSPEHAARINMDVRDDYVQSNRGEQDLKQRAT